MSGAFNAAAHPVGSDSRHLTAGPGPRTAVAGPRGDLPQAEPAGMRNPMAARAALPGAPRGEEQGAQSGGVVRPPLIRHSYSSLFVVPTRPMEDTWPAQRPGTPAWKAWKEVSA
jgi:hypothetical protein